MRISSPILFTAGIILSLAAHAQEDARMVRHFPLSGGGNVEFNADLFDVTLNVEGWDRDEIEVSLEVTPLGKNPQSPEQLWRALVLDLSQRGEGVSFKMDYRRDLFWTWENGPSAMLRVEVKVPKRTRIAIKANDGNLRVSGMEGEVSVENRHGVTFIGATGGKVQARSLRGDISIASCRGDVEVKTVSGQVSIGRVLGLAKLESAGGNIDIQQACGGVEARGNGANLTVGLGRPLTHGARIMTSGGNIVLKLDRDAGCLIDSRASVFGDVRVLNLDLAVLGGGVGKSRLLASVNEGGPRIELEARGGKVVVRGLEPLMQLSSTGP